MPEITLKKGVRLSRKDPKRTFRDSTLIFEALLQALSDGDVDAFKEILAAFLSVANKEQFAAKAQIPKRTLFRMISPSGNPTLETVARVMHALSKAA